MPRILLEEIKGNDPRLIRAVEVWQLVLSVMAICLYSAPLWIVGRPWPEHWLSGLWLGLAGMAALTVVHEALHAQVIILMGGQPRCVVTLAPLAVAITTADVRTYRRNEYLVFFLTPVMILAPLTLLLSWYWYPQPGWVALMVAGLPTLPTAASDLYIAHRIGAHGRETVIESGEGSPARIYQLRPDIE